MTSEIAQHSAISFRDQGPERRKFQSAETWGIGEMFVKCSGLPVSRKKILLQSEFYDVSAPCNSKGPCCYISSIYLAPKGVSTWPKGKLYSYMDALGSWMLAYL